MSDNTDRISVSQDGGSRPGPYLARIVSHLDPSYMGMLEVELLRPVGNESGAEGQLHQVKMMSPFYGVTTIDSVTQQNDYNNTQKSYGMWFVPPDVGTTVMVIFIDGDPKRGYWIGCVPDEAMNFMIPGMAATEYVVEGGGRMPVAEYSKRANTNVQDPTKVKKPRHSTMYETLLAQGLLKDDIRGITTSSARREVPSSVFGISTPGPVDKRTGAKRGPIGKKEHKVVDAYISRMGGTTFVMDDGDDKFLRKKSAYDGPPEYASVSQGETGGLPNIPHNELVRIRTRTGHQILLHNSEDLIYIGNARGTTWIEMTSNGKIDIYAQDSVSVHTSNDLNVTADRDINLTAKGNFNLNAGGTIKMSSSGNCEIKSAADGKITVAGVASILAGAAIAGTATSITWNGTPASPASEAPKASRIPMKEPWAGHENLDPASFKPDKTKASTSPTTPSPSLFEKYTTKTDTFSKAKGKGQ